VYISIHYIGSGPFDGPTIARKKKALRPQEVYSERVVSHETGLANYNRVHEHILMQIETTGANEGWQNTLKMSLRKHQNSHYSFAGVIQTFEDCARVVDNRVAKMKNQWKTKQLSLATLPLAEVVSIARTSDPGRQFKARGAKADGGSQPI
jgi:hypothetical protein